MKSANLPVSDISKQKKDVMLVAKVQHLIVSEMHKKEEIMLSITALLIETRREQRRLFVTRLKGGERKRRENIFVIAGDALPTIIIIWGMLANIGLMYFLFVALVTKKLGNIYFIRLSPCQKKETAGFTQRPLYRLF